MPIQENIDKSMLIQVLPWCWQATCRYMSQDWARSVSPEDVEGHDELKWAIFLSVIFLYTKNCQYILVDQTMSICLTECVVSRN